MISSSSDHTGAIVACAVRPTRRLRIVCAKFGLVVHGPGGNGRRRPGGRARHRRSTPREVDRAAAMIDRSLRAGSIALVTGPSGGGKTSLMRALARRLRARSEPVIEAGHRRAPGGSGGGNCSRRTVLDHLAGLSGSAEEALRLLARAGLADARLLPRRPVELSDGQRHRYAIACAMARAQGRVRYAGTRASVRAGDGESRIHRASRSSTPRRGPGASTPAVTVLIDEFASTLDRVTARSLSATVRRWAHVSSDGAVRVRIVCATAHDDVLEWLGPSVLVYQPAEGRAEVRVR